MSRIVYSVLPLSESVKGKAIKIIAKRKPGTVIHIKNGKPKSTQEIWAWAFNKSRRKVVLNVELCASNGQRVQHKFELPSSCTRDRYKWTNIACGILVCVNKRFIEPITMRATASEIGVVLITGYVNECKAEKQ